MNFLFRAKDIEFEMSNTHFDLLGKGGYVFGSIGLCVCLSVCLLVNNKNFL